MVPIATIDTIAEGVLDDGGAMKCLLIDKDVTYRDRYWLGFLTAYGYNVTYTDIDNSPITIAGFQEYQLVIFCDVDSTDTGWNVTRRDALRDAVDGGVHLIVYDAARVMSNILKYWYGATVPNTYWTNKNISMVDNSYLPNYSTFIPQELQPIDATTIGISIGSTQNVTFITAPNPDTIEPCMKINDTSDIEHNGSWVGYYGEGKVFFFGGTEKNNYGYDDTRNYYPFLDPFMVWIQPDWAILPRKNDEQIVTIRLDDWGSSGSTVSDLANWTYFTSKYPVGMGIVPGSWNETVDNYVNWSRANGSDIWLHGGSTGHVDWSNEGSFPYATILPLIIAGKQMVEERYNTTIYHWGSPNWADTDSVLRAVADADIPFISLRAHQTYPYGANNFSTFMPNKYGCIEAFFDYHIDITAVIPHVARWTYYFIGEGMSSRNPIFVFSHVPSAYASWWMVMDMLNWTTDSLASQGVDLVVKPPNAVFSEFAYNARFPIWEKNAFIHPFNYSISNWTDGVYINVTTQHQLLAGFYCERSIESITIGGVLWYCFNEHYLRTPMINHSTISMKVKYGTFNGQNITGNSSILGAARSGSNIAIWAYGGGKSTWLDPATEERFHSDIWTNVSGTTHLLTVINATDASRLAIRSGIWARFTIRDLNTSEYIVGWDLSDGKRFVPISNHTYSITEAAITIPNSISGKVVSFTAPTFQSASSWFWDFDDGSNSTSQNPSHTYSLSGTYSVTLTVTDEYGATNSTTQEIHILSHAEQIDLLIPLIVAMMGIVIVVMVLANGLVRPFSRIGRRFGS